MADLTMDKLVALCKNRGLIFAGSELYGGLANTWDYGPLGVEFKNNVKKAWWQKFVQESKYNVGLDCAILMNREVWVASGHVGGFNDPLMDCKACKARYRADKLIEDFTGGAETGDGWTNAELEKYIAEHDIVCPKCGKKDFTGIRQFNLMFKTHAGVMETPENEIYLRPETAQVYADMLNAGITPVVYEYGSLGCSGDLAPLAACALVAMGEGEARNADGLKIGGGEALRAAGITPVDLKEKEGLALVNGTDGMLGMLCMAITDLRLLLKTADVAAAMSVEGMLGNDRVFAADLQALRPHRGQGDSAANIARMLKDSGLIEAGRPGSTVRVQDAYSLRCTPQVHGAARDTVEYAASVAGVELASAIDNPCVTLDGRVESNGNFHGAPLAYVLDFLAIPTADVASISERRTDRFLDVARNRGLPAFLAGDPGVDSGFMIAQYTAAGIVSEMKRNAVPASVDSIPSSAMQEDHVSMGWAAARKLRRSIPAFARVLAVELLCSCRSFDFRKPYRPGAAGAAVYRVVRQYANEIGPDVRDTWTTPQIEGVAEAILSGEVLAAAESAVGALK